MRAVFMGTPDFAVGTLEAMLRAGHDVAAVVTKVDKPVGRRMELKPSPVKKCAVDHGIPILQPEKIRGNRAFLDELRAIAPDVIVVAAYGKIIPAEILTLPRYGCLNVHASLLPRYRGAAPIQWAVINGEEKSGVTIMQMNEGLDTGDMIARVEIPLAEDETGGSLFDKLAEAGAGLLTDTLEKVEEGKIVPVPQPADSPTPYARMIRKEDGRINWTQSAAQIERLVRGMNPWPSAFSTLDGRNIRIWKSRTAPSAAGAEPGTVLAADEEGIVVQTGSGALCILELQMEGRKRMKTEAFLRGHRVSPGEKFG